MKKIPLILTLFFTAALITLSITVSVHASFRNNLSHQIKDISDPSISIISLSNKTIYLKSKAGFHASPEPDVYAYYTLYAVKHSKGWKKFNTVQMKIKGYYDGDDKARSRVWTINTDKLKQINFSDKNLDADQDGAVSVDEVRNFAGNLSNQMDSIN